MSRYVSYRKMNTIGVGHVQIDLTFPSGAAEDGTFTDLSLLDDGYLTVPDGYASGVKGINRFDTGEYEIVLWDKYYKFCSGHASVITTENKAVWAQLVFPPYETITDSNNETWFKVRVRVINSSGVCTDLVYNDLISVTLVLDRSSA